KRRRERVPLPEGEAEPTAGLVIEDSIAALAAEPPVVPATDDVPAVLQVLNIAPEIISGENGSDDLPEPMALAPESPAAGAAEAAEEEAAPAFSLDEVPPSADTIIPASEPAIDIAHPQRQLGFEVSDSTQTPATVEPVVQVASVTETSYAAPRTPVEPRVETATTAAEPRRAANDPRAAPGRRHHRGDLQHPGTLVRPDRYQSAAARGGQHCVRAASGK
ncbi:MAG: hypothetical protein WBN82_12780, partial [Porticoccaceae bacterium]